MKPVTIRMTFAFGLLALLAACQPEPRTMLAIEMHAHGGPEVLRMVEVTVPDPAAGEVLIRVRAAAVNPFDWKLREGLVRIPGMQVRIPGLDVSGTIEALGPGVEGWQAGDAVIAALHRSGQGGYAEYATARADDIAAKPAAMSFAEAAGIPTVGMAAWQYLIEIGGLQPGQRVLIHGGAGGVGSTAVQIAAARDAHVIATASGRNHEYLRSLGADEVIDYHSTRFEDVVADADLVLDTVGGETLERSPAALKPGGTLVSLVGKLPDEICAERRIRCPPQATPGTDAFGPRLAEIVALAESGDFRVHVDRLFALEEAAAAQELNREGHTRGKIVLEIAP